MNKTTAQASHALDEALALVEASNRRIAGMEPTVILMGIARHGNENLISRAQAKRISSEIEKLEHVLEVVLDFSGVQEIGQGFADQLFRVFAKSHPEVALTPIHCAPSCGTSARRYRRSKRGINLFPPALAGGFVVQP